MELGERYLPQFQFVERHQLPLRATARQALDAVGDLTVHDDPLVRTLLRIREAPARLAGALGRENRLKDRPPFGLHEFTLLERDADQALAYGLIGRFWRSDFGLERVDDANAFSAYAEPGVAKLLMGFHCSPGTDGGIVLHTETRVHCPDRRSRLLFTPYWLAIRPASGLIRRRLLAAIQRQVGAP
ncbi:hypothetical protein [Pseudomonas tohonis]|uniref:hypothetical protein n=1 Tax=Pseudomonas tohonis TaxID=2725477 RepID=UPI0022F0C368|nr:hypothetical protein [Pseudomonas tohonis]